MSRNMHFLPELEGAERFFIQDLIEEMSGPGSTVRECISGKEKGPEQSLGRRDCRISCHPGLPAVLARPHWNGISLLMHSGAILGWLSRRYSSFQEASLDSQPKNRSADSD
jgi:hypothetical protein